MDTIIKGLADLLLVGGTVGGYAMITIIMLIVGYFKYLKPFLAEFYTIQGKLQVFVVAHDKLNDKGEDISRTLQKILELSETEHSTLSAKIDSEHKKHQTELLNLLQILNKELDALQGDSDKSKVRSEDNHREIMVEIARLQTRLEFMNQSGVRGLQK